ncbi:hypothetical protein DPMN_021918 [Dreissena polymorpha]|uniref:Uncharacterized protein n=1 Tax=Dreissena polymorpha TaxID=45954 RepID=A0A9D4NJE1_DREPO|nr:hypothetical protein DPMN_021918 [Dreissena polymorpha]
MLLSKNVSLTTDELSAIDAIQQQFRVWDGELASGLHLCHWPGRSRSSNKNSNKFKRRDLGYGAS